MCCACAIQVPLDVQLFAVCHETVLSWTWGLEYPYMGSTSRHCYTNLLTSQYGGKEMGIWLFKCHETERNRKSIVNPAPYFPLPGNPAPSHCASDAKEPSAPVDVPSQQGVILAQDEESVTGAS